MEHFSCIGGDRDNVLATLQFNEHKFISQLFILSTLVVILEKTRKKGSENLLFRLDELVSHFRRIIFEKIDEVASYSMVIVDFLGF